MPTLEGTYIHDNLLRLHKLFGFIQEVDGESTDCSNTSGGKRVSNNQKNLIHVCIVYPRWMICLRKHHFIAHKTAFPKICILQIPGVLEGVSLESLGARYILVVEKDAIFTYLCGQRIWDTLPCIVVTGCGYPPLSVRAVVKQLATQLSLPVVGLFDYNPHGLRILLTYKFGSTRMGLEAHAYATDVKWLGVHHDDVFDRNGQAKIEESALQQWSTSDERTYTGVVGQIELMENPFYTREVKLMGEKRVKAEIEALNNDGFNLLEQKIIQKILRKKFF